MLGLAWPVILAELGWIGMGVVDTMMVGRVDAEAIGAVSLGHMLFFAIAIFGMGLLLGLDTLVAQAYGARDLRDCHRSLLQGCWVSLALTVPVTAIVLVCLPFLDRWGFDPVVAARMGPYLEAITWSALPLFLYATFRRYLQATNHVRAVMFALVTANGINAFSNWILIFGHLGAPSLGVEGAGWATLISRIYMTGFLLVSILVADREGGGRLWNVSWRPDGARIRQLLGLGLPAAFQTTLEVGMFAAATALAGLLEPVALAAHHIALNVASVTFMIPLGLSSAAAVRVGQAIGGKNPAGARRAGWTALLYAAAFASASALAFVILPGAILRVFTPEPGVIERGISLLYVAAIFQLFDGIQAVATGALRGTGETRIPLIWNLVGFWAVGLPVGAWLCFRAGWGVSGLWIGLCVGLMLVGGGLLRAWKRKVGLLLKPIRPAG